jgi:hypothetical protein
MTLVELYIAMDEDGNYEVASEASDASERLLEAGYGNNMVRVVKINVTMEPPTEIEASVTVPNDAGKVEAVIPE